VAIDASSRVVLNGLVERIDLDQLAAQVHRGVEEMPEYRGFVGGRDDADDRGPAAIRWNLGAFFAWAVGEGPPSAAELERLRELIGARAAEGHPPEQGLAVYRRAMRSGWEAVLERADAEERAALGGAFELPLEWLDVISRLFEEAYAEQRDSLVFRQERRARWLFERLLEGAGESADDRRLAEAIGFRLGAPYRPLIAAQPGDTAAQHLQLAARLRELGVLASTEGERVAGLADPALDPARLGLGSRVLICAGDAGEGAELAEALGDLRVAAELAAAAGEAGRIELDRHLPELLLRRAPSLERRLRRRVFGPLEEAGRPDLVETLEALAEHGFERVATAAALHLHRNTLAQRIERIEALGGPDLGDPGDRGLVWLACRAER
jgi:DNA-binding PucR family transcriptional regulator